MTKDVLELLNAMFPFPSHHSENIYYHPCQSYILSDHRRRFAIDPPFVQERKGDYSYADTVKEKWTPKTGTTCDRLGPCISLEEKISSSLLLYRVLCLFEIPDTWQQNGVWSVHLQHVQYPSQRVLLYDHLGSANVKKTTTSDDVGSGRSKNFETDFDNLLGLLFSDRCPHPYDETVAGSCA